MGRGLRRLLRGRRRAGGRRPRAARARRILPLDADDTLPFSSSTRTEDIAHPGTVFLFGRVPVDASATGAASTETVSACAVVTGMQRCMFVVPRPDVFGDAGGEIESLERAAAEAAKGSDEAAAKKARGALLRTLQMRAKDVKDRSARSSSRAASSRSR